MRSRRALFLAVAVVCLASSAAWAGTPAERGPYSLGEFREHLVDASRGREMDLLVLYPLTTPATGDPAARFPLIVFNHGFLLRGDVYRLTGEHLASHGFVVALPTYPMSFFNLNHVALALDARYIIDHCLALDANPKSALYGVVDESAIGASGHSLGGKISLLEATTDSRVRAIAALDPVDGGGPVAADPIAYPSVAPERMNDIHVPLLLVGAELGRVTHFFTPCAPENDNYQRFYEAAHSPAIEITQLGAGHAQYVDPGAESALAACAPGTASSEWVRSSSAAYLTAFFLGHLSGDASALAWLDARLAEDEAQNRIVVRRKQETGTPP
jgi:dienelactone hydrolase